MVKLYAKALSANGRAEIELDANTTVFIEEYNDKKILIIKYNGYYAFICPLDNLEYCYYEVS